jgi:flagellar motor protein MotB
MRRGDEHRADQAERAASCGAPFTPGPADEDQTAWLLTFSDLVLQLFAFVLVAAVLGGAGALSHATPPPVVTTAPPAAEHTAEETDFPPRIVALRRHPETAARKDVSPASPPVAASEPLESQAATVALPATTTQPDPEPVVAEATATEPVVALPTVPPPPAEAAAPATDTHLSREPEKASDVSHLLAAGRYLKSLIAEQRKEDVVRVIVGDAEVVVSLEDKIGFTSGSAELRPEARQIVDDLRALVGAMPEVRVEVAGHTDDVPIHNSLFPSNLELSLARAARVAHEIGSADASLEARTLAAGFGEHRPIASNLDARGRAQNRRVEIRLLLGEPSTS